MASKNRLSWEFLGIGFLGLAFLSLIIYYKIVNGNGILNGAEAIILFIVVLSAFLSAVCLFIGKIYYDIPQTNGKVKA